MRYLWIIAGIMIVLGLLLALGSVTAGIGPIALVCGVLLVWSGIVKVIVLRVWQKTLHAPTQTRQGPAAAAHRLFPRG
jgi:hypothetical protein